MGTQKNGLNETVLLSTQNICQKLWVRKKLQFYQEFFVYLNLCCCFSGGTYNNQTRMDQSGDCKPCPSRKYCKEGSETDGLDCPAGFYCVEGQSTGEVNACPVGTYSNLTGLNGNYSFRLAKLSTVKLVLFIYPSIEINVFGAQKNRLIETVLLRTHNICFG